MQTTSNPSNWFVTACSALQWPVIVVAAFWLGRGMSKLENRVLKAEKNMQDIIERHLPHIHQALADLKTGLEVVKSAVLNRAR